MVEFKTKKDKTNAFESVAKEVNKFQDHRVWRDNRKKKADSKRTVSGQKADSKRTVSGQKNRADKKKADTLADSKRTASGQLADSKRTEDVLLLSRNERLIFQSIFDLANINGNRIDQKITMENLAELTEIASKTGLKKSLERVIKKGFLVRKTGKKGPGGWLAFEIPEATYNKAFLMKADNKRTVSGQLADTLADTLADKPPSSSSSSSSSNNKKITTTESLPQDWLDINLAPLADIGFTRHHLLQIYNDGVLTAAMVRDSLQHFNFDISENEKKFKKAPINIVMGVLRKGDLYNAPDGYISPQDRALAKYQEQEQARLDKSRQIDEMASSTAFMDWQSKLSEAQIRDIIPTACHNQIGTDDPGIHAMLRDHFIENDWPAIRAKITELM